MTMSGAAPGVGRFLTLCATVVVLVASTGNADAMSRSASAAAAAPSAPVSVPAADFDGNRQSDIAVWRPSTGTWWIRAGSAVLWGASGDVPQPGDYNGDGTTDVAVWRPSTGTWLVRNGSTVSWGVSTDVPVPADYNGDRTTDFAVWRPGDGTWWVRGSATVQWGVSTDLPVPGDYNGDRSAEIAVWRPSTGTWWIRGGATVQWGVSDDIPVPGDYNGDGTTEMAVWRPSTGTWWIRGGATVQWGVSGDVPVPADYNGDGTTDIAVWRPSSGTWWIRNGTSVQWGEATDVPTGSRAGAAASSADTQPPSQPTGLAVTGSTTTSVTLAWNASTDNVGVTGYAVFRNGVELARTSSTSFVFSSLTCGTAYTLGVEAYDAAGNRSTRGALSAATASCPDTSPPTTPTGLMASATAQTSISVTWTASSDNVGVTGYSAYRGGTLVATTGSTSYTFSGLTCGTSYALAVDAYDAAGNRSGKAQLSASTSACAPASDCDRYASTTGSNSNAGTATAPYRNVSYLFGKLSAGQTGCLLGGTFSENVNASNGGQPGSPLTVKSAPGYKATIKGIVDLSAASHDIVVADLILNGNVGSWTASPQVNGDRITFRNNEITNQHTAICLLLGAGFESLGTADDAVIDGNRIHDCGRLPATGHDHGIYVEGTRNARIVNNTIYDNADYGIHLYPEGDGSYIANNIIDGNGRGLIFAGERSGGEYSSAHSSDNNVVENNIISNSTDTYNIESWWGGPVGTGNVARYNCVWNGARGNIDLSDGGFSAISNIVADPLYVNRSAKDFRLQSGSPCTGKAPK